MTKIVIGIQDGDILSISSTEPIEYTVINYDYDKPRITSEKEEQNQIIQGSVERFIEEVTY